jgi:hypothetical protein
MMELKIVKLFLQPSNLLLVCRHAGVVAVRLSHDWVDDELRVTADVWPLNPELGSDAHVINECLVFCHIVSHVEVQSNYIEELEFHFLSSGV